MRSRTKLTCAGASIMGDEGTRWWRERKRHLGQLMTANEGLHTIRAHTPDNH